MFKNAQEFVSHAHYIVHMFGLVTQTFLAKHLCFQDNPHAGFDGIVLAQIYKWSPLVQYSSKIFMIE